MFEINIVINSTKFGEVGTRTNQQHTAITSELQWQGSEAKKRTYF